MSVIIRLQNLALTANSIDIRNFFRGLSIPDGGVHIVGGSEGDAFIAFSTDEDARQAMQLTGTCLKDSPVKLLLSSRNEMYKVIEQARQQAHLGLMPGNPISPSQSPADNSATSSTPIAASSNPLTQSSNSGQLANINSGNQSFSHLTPQNQMLPNLGLTFPNALGSGSNNSNNNGNQINPFPSLVGPLVNNMSLIPNNFPGGMLGQQQGFPMMPPQQAASLFSNPPPSTNTLPHQGSRNIVNQMTHQQSQNPFTLAQGGGGGGGPTGNSNIPMSGFPGGHIPSSNNNSASLNSSTIMSGIPPPTPSGLMGLSNAMSHLPTGPTSMGPGQFGQLGGNKMPSMMGNLNAMNSTQHPAGLMPSFNNMGHSQQQQQQRSEQGFHSGGMLSSLGMGSGGMSNISLPSGLNSQSMGPMGGGHGPRPNFNNQQQQQQQQQQKQAPKLLVPSTGHDKLAESRGNVHNYGNKMSNLSAGGPFGGPPPQRDIRESNANLSNRVGGGGVSGDRDVPAVIRGERDLMGNRGREKERIDRVKKSQSRSRERKERNRRRSRSRERRSRSRERRRTRRSRSKSRSRDRGKGRRGSRDRGGREERRRSDAGSSTTGSPEKGRSSQDKSTPSAKNAENAVLNKGLHFGASTENDKKLTGNGQPVEPIIITISDDAVFPCIKLTGLGKDTSFREIREFVHVEIQGGGEGVVRNYEKGLAFLKLENSAEFPKALKQSGQKLRGATIKVEGTTLEIWEAEYKQQKREREKERERERERDRERDRDRDFRDRERSERQRTSRFNGGASSQSNCISIRGLPPGISTKELSGKFFRDVNILDIVTVPTEAPNGRQTCTAFVHFESFPAAQRAIDIIVKSPDGTNFVVEFCELDVLQRARRDSFGAGGGRLGPNNRDRDNKNPAETKSLFELDIGMDMESSSVVITGAPPNATDRSVVDFFSEIGIIPMNIEIVYDNHGNPTGQVVCEFQDPHKARRATTKDGMLFGRSSVQVSLLPSTNRASNMANTSHLGGGPGVPNFPNNNNPRAIRPALLGPRPPHGNTSNPRFSNNNNNNNNNSSQNPFTQALQQSSMPTVNNPSLMNSVPTNRMRGPGERTSRFSNSNSASGDQPNIIDRDDRPKHGAPHQEEVDIFSNPGCVLALENVPFKASMDDILNFLKDMLGIQIPRSRIIRRYDEMQKPTGDARVAFATPFEAKLAHQRLVGSTMWKRPISISVLNFF